jgi:ABC-2 type transport system ATP-binding protein
VVTPLIFAGTTKKYGQHVALNQLSLKLEPGEILGFLGPNGAGKTTAIHLAMGFLQPTEGGGTILGQPFGDTVTRSKVGFLPDSPTFFAGNAHSAMELAGKLNNLSNPQLRERTVALLGQLSLSAAGQDARKFSRGMQQRLGLAQAMVNDPELLILDEPTSALDPPGVLEVRELLRAARDEGKSIFFSSHQLSEVEQICDRIAFLDHGKLLRHGSLASFLEDSGHVEVVLSGLSPDAEALRKYRQYKSAPANGSTRFVVPLRLQRELIEQAWLAGGELVSVAPLRRTLEELFVAWSRENNTEPQRNE